MAPTDIVEIPRTIEKLRPPGLGPRQVRDYGERKLVLAVKGSTRNKQYCYSGFLIWREWEDSWFQDLLFFLPPIRSDPI